MSKKPKSIIECFKLAEGITSRKKAQKLLKRYNKLLNKSNDLRKNTTEDSTQR